MAIQAYGLNDWLNILCPEGWELYDLETTELTARTIEVVDRYIDTICNSALKNLQPNERAEVTGQWRHVMHIFNRNHAHLGFMELALRKQQGNDREQPELFLPVGAFDHFFEMAQVKPLAY